MLQIWDDDFKEVVRFAGNEECFDGNVASNLPDNGEVQKFADEKTQDGCS
jgi:hypothetical protein